MGKVTKKLWAFALTLIMVISMMPTTIAKAETEGGSAYDAFEPTETCPYVVEYECFNKGTVARPEGISDENFITEGRRAKVRVANTVESLTFQLNPEEGEGIGGIRIEQEGTEGNEHGFVDLEDDTRYNAEAGTFTIDLRDSRYTDPEVSTVKFVYINFDFTGRSEYDMFGPTEEYPYVVEYECFNRGMVARPEGIPNDNFISEENRAKVRVANTEESLIFQLNPEKGEGIGGIRIEQEGTEGNEDGFVDLKNDPRYSAEAGTFTLDLKDDRYTDSGVESVKFIHICFDFTGGPSGPTDDNIEVHFPGDAVVDGNTVTYQVEGQDVTVTISEGVMDSVHGAAIIPRSEMGNVTFQVDENFNSDTMEVNLRGDNGFCLPLIVDGDGRTTLTAFEGDHGIPESVVFNVERKGNNPPGPEPMPEGIQFQVKGPDRGTVSYQIGGAIDAINNLDEEKSTDQRSITYAFEADTEVSFSVTPSEENGDTEIRVHIESSESDENVGEEMDKKYAGGFMSQIEQGKSVSFTAIAGHSYVIRVEFGQQDMPWYTVSWAGGNVTVENGEVIAERVHIAAHDEEPAITYTINEDEVDEEHNVYYVWDTIGKQKEHEEDPDSLQLYGLGFSQSDLFIANGLEGVTIDYKFIPKYGYQLKNIYTNEDQEESCLNDFKTDDKNISTFTFGVRPNENVHFCVYFAKTDDTIVTKDAKSIQGASIANGNNAVTSGNLSLKVEDTQVDSSVANAVSTFDVTLDNIVSKGEDKGNWVSNITEFESPVTLTLNLDTKVYTSNEYEVVREHNGKHEKINASYNATTGALTFQTNKFSSYSIVGVAAPKVEPAHQHTYDAGKVTKEPTETEEGVKTYTCTGCGQTKTEAIAKKEAVAKKEPAKGDAVTDTKTGANVEVLDPAKKEVVYTAPSDTKQKEVKIPEQVEIGGETYKVTKVEDEAFKGNKTVTKVTIPASVETIGKDAFNGCDKLKTVNVSKNVTEIGANAFKGCKALTKVTLPAKTNKIGANAFNGCKKMKTITVKATKLTKKDVANNAFKGLPKSTTIKVPKKQLKTYKKLFKSKGFKGKVKA